MKILILAGGFATRLWPITEKRAKPLMILNGKPIISHIIDKIPDEYEIIISTNQVFENEFFAWRNKYPNRKIKIFIEDSGSDDFKKGALGAVALVIRKEALDDDLMLIAGDNYFGFLVSDFIGRYNSNPLLAVFDIDDLEEAKKYGVLVTEEDIVVGFQEKPEQPKSTLVSTGCYVFPKRNLKDIIYYSKQKNDDLGGVFEYLLQKKEVVEYYRFVDVWYDIGAFSSYIDAHKKLQNGGTIVCSNTCVDLDSKLVGSVYIGQNTVIENSVIEDSIIMDNTKLKDCVVRGSIIGEGSFLQSIDLNNKMIRDNINILN